MAKDKYQMSNAKYQINVKAPMFKTDQMGF